ncbi:L-2-haloalkanoic acid dehalogenase [Paenibacillus sp. FSL H8-0548]|uniref:HAD family hydrolase n=1 Tax=Paenibacillus sp. FSL H8-0548 TaxID=1920422 RepID=UPI00096E4C71|nr:HAD family hydrolase [Paenibacillus sp. FSL H8-0548]OMF23473.1 L-2-haloalkanoic acid dehalogenase [Paenibacillus sp. FSL H8-0548]
MGIKAVLFDLDGTLLDRDASLARFVREQYERLFNQSGIDKELYVNRFIELDNHGYVWKDKVYQQLILEFSIDSLEWEELLSDYVAKFQDHCIGYPHLNEMLTELKASGIKLALVSNGYGQFQFDNFKALKIDHLFDEVLISEWEGLRKPDPAIFNRALSKLGVEAKDALFVGDHLDNDIRASESVGMKAIWKRNDQSLADNAVAVTSIEDLAELIPIVSSL